MNLGRMLKNWIMPSHVHPLPRAQMPRELRTWSMFGLTLGAVEGGVLGVIVNSSFDQVVEEFWLHLAVALVAGAPSFSNLLSLFWAGHSHGRHKIAYMLRLQALTLACVLLAAFSPLNTPGLVWFVFCTILARVAWSGVITLRSTVWRANFPRHIRATLAGKLATFTSVLMAVSGMIAGKWLEYDAMSFRWVFPLAAGFGLIGLYAYRKTGIRGHKVLLKKEREIDRVAVGLGEAFRILKRDRAYRGYMLGMFVFGSGNLMLTAPLILLLNEQGISATTQVLITSSIPLVVIPLTIPFWAKRLDGMHVVAFRAMHSWVFVLAHSCLLTGALTHIVFFYWLGAALLGTGYAGGLLGWNLGHHDFAPPEKAAQYMGIHVSLTGLRGLIMPIVGVSVFNLLAAYGHGWQDYTLALSLLLVICGTVIFTRLKAGLKNPLEHPERKNTATAQIRSSSSHS